MFSEEIVWYSVEDLLPDYGEYVMWIDSEGFLIYTDIPNEVDQNWIREFVNGEEHSSPLKYWAKVEGPTFDKDMEHA